MIDKTTNAPNYRPLYDQIKVLLTQSLIGGEWRPGEMIPSEIDLAGRYKVSQGTVRKAIDSLASENILIRRQGKGTFVTASVTDPFGNILGIMTNVHYLDILKQKNS